MDNANGQDFTWAYVTLIPVPILFHLSQPAATRSRSRPFLAGADLIWWQYFLAWDDLFGWCRSYLEPIFFGWSRPFLAVAEIFFGCSRPFLAGADHFLGWSRPFFWLEPTFFLVAPTIIGWSQTFNIASSANILWMKTSFFTFQMSAFSHF